PEAAWRVLVCGIAGIIFLDGSREVAHSDLEAMSRTLAHRGPDDQGTLVDGSIGLTVRRLSVIDPLRGRQPIWNERHDIAVILNGEIYNHPELRSELSQRGHQFTSSSDTEVIVHLYEETGPTTKLPSRLLGMFALAVYDQARRMLFLARDRAGKKPLYYY